MTEPLRGSYLEMMQAHVDEGGRLSHRNGVDLLAEVARLRGMGEQAAPQEKFDFLAGEVRKALACFDRMPLQQYFDRVEQNDPLALAILGAFDHLAPALNVLGISTKQLSDTHRPENQTS